MVRSYIDNQRMCAHQLFVRARCQLTHRQPLPNHKGKSRFRAFIVNIVLLGYPRLCIVPGVDGLHEKSL